MTNSPKLHKLCGNFFIKTMLKWWIAMMIEPVAFFIFITLFLVVVALASSYTTNKYRKVVNTSLAALFKRPQVNPLLSFSGTGDVVSGNYRGHLVTLNWLLSSTGVDITIKTPNPSISNFIVNPNEIRRNQVDMKKKFPSGNPVLWQKLCCLDKVSQIYSNNGYINVTVFYNGYKPKVVDLTKQVQVILQLIVEISDPGCRQDALNKNIDSNVARWSNR
jgi:hypothetical protein